MAIRWCVALACALVAVTVSVAESPRAQVTVENWDKGAALSHWIYTHLSEFFPTAVIRRGGPILNLPTQLKPETIGWPLTSRAFGSPLASSMARRIPMSALADCARANEFALSL